VGTPDENRRLIEALRAVIVEGGALDAGAPA
jgi:hypothetical protein